MTQPTDVATRTARAIESGDPLRLLRLVLAFAIAVVANPVLAEPLPLHIGGQWGSVLPWPHVPVSMALLPDGRVLTYSSNERDSFPNDNEWTYAGVWDPATGIVTEIPHPAHDMFCATMAMLEDGRVFIAGGRNFEDSPWTSVFDYRNDSWVPLENMNRGRWYPTSLALPTGQVFVAAGLGGLQHPEIWTPGSGWQLLTGIDLTAPILQYGSARNGGDMWPLMQLQLDGKVIHLGATPIMHRMDTTGLGSIEALGPHGMSWFPDEAVFVAYDEGKLLIAGGSTSITDDTSSDQAVVVDITGPGPVITPIAPMNYPRQFHNEVLLPTGEVLILGGNTDGVQFDDVNSVYEGEMWNPTSQAWRVLNPASVPRNYHSTATLLLDGRVLSGGGGLKNGSSAPDHLDGQVYSPPYLFDVNDQLVARPVIADGPAAIRVGAVFPVQATAGLSRFTVVKVSAVTHTQDQDQRFLEVAFSEDSPGVYTLTSHSNPNVLTPGYWMLFGLDSQDVPSEAWVVQVVTSGRPLVDPVTDPRNRVGDEVSLVIEAVDPDGDPLNFGAANLPPGLSIDPASGEISGIPTQSGISNVDVLVDDGTNSVALEFRWFVALPQIQSEIGELTIAQSGPGEWHPVALQNIYVDPVVVLGVLSDNDDAPTTVRVRNVTATDFEMQIDEWNDLDGIHGSESLAYLVVEAGAHVLDNGQAVVASHTAAVDQGWLADGFPVGAFTQPPILIAQTTTAGHPDASVTRLKNVTSSGFEVKLQEQEGHADQLVGSERVDWIAIDPGTRPGELISAHTGIAIDHNPYTLNFSPAFGAAPHLFAKVETNPDGDPFSLRYQNASATSTQIWVDEETSRDAETSHLLEGVGWLAIDPAVTELGLTALFNSAPTIVNPGPQVDEEGEIISMLPEVDDADGDLVTLSATGLPVGLSVDPEAGLIEGTLSTPGAYNTVVTITDLNGASADAAFTWTVLETLTLLPFATPPQPSGNSVSFAASVNLGVSVEYVWDFGDGSPAEGPFASSSIDHTFAAPGRYVVTLTVTEPTSGATDVLQFDQVIHAPVLTNAPIQSSSIAYEAAADRIWVANPDNDTVTVLDALDGTKQAEIPVAAGPRSVAIAADGVVWVTNKAAATITLLDPVTLTPVSTIPLMRGSRPHGLVFTPDGAFALVALESLGLVVKLDGISGAFIDTADVGPRPRHLSVTADGATALISRFVTPPLPGESTVSPLTTAGGEPVGGEVVPMNIATCAVDPVIVLEHSDAPRTEQSGPGFPNYLGAPAISPDGSSAWIPSKQDNILGGAARDGIDLDHDSTVRAIVSRIDLATLSANWLDRVDHDDASLVSAARFDPTGSYLFASLQGVRAVAVIDPFSHSELGRFDVGRAPQGLALSPDGRTLYVHNFMDRSVSVHDLSALIDFGSVSVPAGTTWSLVASEVLSVDVLNGKQLFYDSFDPRIALDGYLACASCHSEGGQDGRVWDFTQFGEGLRNTISLSGHGQGHGPLHRTANFDEVQDFENQIRAFGALGLMDDADYSVGTRSDPLGDPKATVSADLDALAAYVESLTATPDSPWREESGALTDEGALGRTVFALAGCDSCHAGPEFTDSPLGFAHDVGTLTAASGPFSALDVPSIRGLWDSAPYLHDGSAATLSDAVTRHSGTNLSSENLAFVAQFLLEVDEAETNGPLPPRTKKACGLSTEVGIAIALLLAARRRRDARSTRPRGGR